MSEHDRGLNIHSYISKPDKTTFICDEAQLYKKNIIPTSPRFVLLGPHPGAGLGLPDECLVHGLKQQHGPTFL